MRLTGTQGYGIIHTYTEETRMHRNAQYTEKNRRIGPPEKESSFSVPCGGTGQKFPSPVSAPLPCPEKRKQYAHDAGRTAPPESAPESGNADRKAADAAARRSIGDTAENRSGEEYPQMQSPHSGKGSAFSGRTVHTKTPPASAAGMKFPSSGRTERPRKSTAAAARRPPEAAAAEENIVSVKRNAGSAYRPYGAAPRPAAPHASAASANEIPLPDTAMQGGENLSPTASAEMLPPALL